MLRSAAWALLVGLLVAGRAGSAQDRDAELQRVLGEAEQVIAESESVPAGEDKAEWRARLRDLVRHWQEFRDARCDVRQIAYEEGSDPAAVRRAATSCRQSLDAAIAADLRDRYVPTEETHGRPSLDSAVDSAPFRPAEPDALTCDPPPPAECDYCGVNVCWQRKLAEDDAELNALRRRVLAHIGRRARTSAARADWLERLRIGQRAWMLLRDDNYDLESWETPNRFAHSIYATQLAPCLHAETQARIAWLRSRYLGGVTPLG